MKTLKIYFRKYDMKKKEDIAYIFALFTAAIGGIDIGAWHQLIGDKSLGTNLVQTLITFTSLFSFISILLEKISLGKIRLVARICSIINVMLVIIALYNNNIYVMVTTVQIAFSMLFKVTDQFYDHHLETYKQNINMRMYRSRIRVYSALGLTLATLIVLVISTVGPMVLVGMGTISTILIMNLEMYLLDRAKTINNISTKEIELYKAYVEEDYKYH